MLKRLSIFNRLLLSYILATLVPVMLLFILLYNSSVANLRNEVESFTVSNLYKIKETIDQRIRECNSIAAQISINPKLTVHSMNTEHTKAMEGIEELSKYKAGNAFVSDILISYKDSGDAFSFKGKLSLEVLFGRSLNLSEADRLGAYEELRKLDAPVLKTFASSDSMMYMVPLPLNGGARTGTAIFIFQGSSIKKMLSQGKTEFLGTTYVLDAGNKPLLTINQNDNSTSTSGVPALLGQVQGGIYSVDYENESYSVIKTASDETGWTYATVMPKSQFLEKVNSQEAYIIVSTILIVIICVTVALALALSNYRPIKKLHRLIKEYLPKPEKPRGSAIDEIDRIHQAINNTLSLNRTLANQLDDQKNYMKQNLLLRLLEGDLDYLEDWPLHLESSGLRLAGPCYAVVVVYYDPYDEEAPKYNERLLDWLSKSFFNGHDAYAVEIRSGNCIAMVMNLDQADRYRELAQRTEEILAVYEEGVRERIRIGVGTAVEGIIRIRHSYIEAFAALERRNTLPDQQIFVFDEALLLPEAYWVSAEDQLHLMHSLKQGDRQMACNVLDRMLHEIESRQMPPAFTRFICYKICDLVLKVMQELPSASHEPFDTTLFNGAFGRAISFASLADFREHIVLLIDGICRTVKELNEKRDTGLVSHVLSFVHDNYKEAGISLDMISARFGYSNHYWSRFFKEKIHCHFTDYLWNLRSEEAKQQFIHTDKTIKEIVTEIGYIDITSFILKFKNEEGITPGQFRKLYAADQKEMQQP
jgi:two-component system response regulator YesN